MNRLRFPLFYLGTFVISAIALGAAAPAACGQIDLHNPLLRSQTTGPVGEAGPGGTPPSALTAPHLKPAAQSRAGDIYAKKNIRALMSRVFAWQVANPVEINAKNNNLWARAAFYAGVMAAFRATGDREYFRQALAWAEGRGWKLGDRPRHADDQAPGQTFLELYLLQKDPSRIAHTRSTLDAMVSSPRPGREDWWWCDALFMAP